MEEEIACYTIFEAVTEARRCLNCPKPLCKTGCPIENDIPQFNHALAQGNMGEAYRIISQKSNLPAICSRVCPHENQCEGHCVLTKAGKGIKIGRIERFIADFYSENHLSSEKIVPKTESKVAVIGSGPAGLSVAGDLARKGFNVVVYEGESIIKANNNGTPLIMESKNIINKATIIITIEQVKTILKMRKNFSKNITKPAFFFVTTIFLSFFFLVGIITILQ